MFLLKCSSSSAQQHQLMSHMIPEVAALQPPYETVHFNIITIVGLNITGTQLVM